MTERTVAGSGVAVGMVLAAGRGRRMRPLSDVLPKPALPVLDRPLVRFALEQAARAGAPRLVVNTWHLAERMARAVREAAHGLPPIALSSEPELLGGAGGLALARDRGLLGTEGPVIVVNGDGVLDLDPAPLVAAHRERSDDVTLALLPHPGSDRWSRVLLDETGRITAILRGEERTPDREAFLYPGVMIVSRRALNALPSGPGETAERLWWPARDAGRLGGVIVRGTWREVGTPEDYLKAVIERLAGRCWLHASARVDPTATVLSAMIGRDCAVGARTTVERSAIAEGVTVEPGAVVVDSVILGP
ncbi:MAG TPA: hypothetical protein ENK19_05030, partial [Acidobacteria bacterium]|nr:hypothetical protein [Acidobacteriota bacterium]